MTDERGPVAIYVQIADAVAGMIERGELRPHQAIPSEARLQQEWGVSRDTVRAAVRLLRERGLVYTVAEVGAVRGTYVADQT
jgi:DNA-binding GntR family transcriptional regulator